MTRDQGHSPIELYVLPFSVAKQHSEKKINHLSNK